MWARLVPSSIQWQFWSTMGRVSKGMLVAEESQQFIDLYRELGSSLARYLFRNMGGLILACLPAIVLGYALDAWLFEPWDARDDLQLVFLCTAPLGAIVALLIRRRRA